MKRAIVTPPVLSSAALSEIKQWLGITTMQDDAVLTALLRAGLEICEAFTGSVPIEANCEEVLPLSGSGWQTLVTRPVQVNNRGRCNTLHRWHAQRTDTPSAFAIELDADGGGRVDGLEPRLCRAACGALPCGPRARLGNPARRPAAWPTPLCRPPAPRTREPWRRGRRCRRPRSPRCGGLGGGCIWHDFGCQRPILSRSPAALPPRPGRLAEAQAESNSPAKSAAIPQRWRKARLCSGH